MTFETLAPEVKAARDRLAALSGRAPRLVGADAALAALRAGAHGVLAVVPWDEEVDGVAHPTNHLLLRGLDGDRLLVEHPLVAQVPAAPGTALGGPGRGPLRRREAGGADSLALTTFAQLLALGGAALLPG